MDTKTRLLIAVVALVAVVGVLLASTFFVVDERQQALVIQFGAIKKEVREAGLHTKIPFVQTVVIYDRRVLDLNPPTEQVLLVDQKRVEVDAFARYRIVDPTKFYQSVGSEQVAEQRLNSVTSAALRRVLGGVTLQQVLSKERGAVMQRIRAQVDEEAQRFGIHLVEVRIRRADLPEATSQSIYARMKSEREREAAEFRAQGAEQAQQIRAKADRERTVLIAEAERDAQVLRGQGDAEAIKIYADAFSRDAEFYGFYRSLQAYRKTLGAEDTTMVLSPNSEFLRYFQRLPGDSKPAAQR